MARCTFGKVCNETSHASCRVGVPVRPRVSTIVIFHNQPITRGQPVSAATNYSGAMLLLNEPAGKDALPT